MSAETSAKNGERTRARIFAALRTVSAKGRVDTDSVMQAVLRDGGPAITRDTVLRWLHWMTHVGIVQRTPTGRGHTWALTKREVQP